MPADIFAITPNHIVAFAADGSLVGYEAHPGVDDYGSGSIAALNDFVYIAQWGGADWGEVWNRDLTVANLTWGVPPYAVADFNGFHGALAVGKGGTLWIAGTPTGPDGDDTKNLWHVAVDGTVLASYTINDGEHVDKIGTSRLGGPIYYISGAAAGAVGRFHPATGVDMPTWASVGDFIFVEDLHVATNGDVYVAHRDSDGVVTRFDSGGTVVGEWGYAFGDFQGVDNPNPNDASICLDADETHVLYWAYTGNRSVECVWRWGINDHTGTDTQTPWIVAPIEISYGTAQGIAVRVADPGPPYVYITGGPYNGGERRVRKFAKDGTLLAEYADVTGTLDFAGGDTNADESLVFVADPTNGVVHKFDSDLNLLADLGAAIFTAGGILGPSDVCVIGAELFVCQAAGKKIFKIDASGALIDQWTLTAWGGTSGGSFFDIDPADNDTVFLRMDDGNVWRYIMSTNTLDASAWVDLPNYPGGVRVHNGILTLGAYGSVQTWSAVAAATAVEFYDGGSALWSVTLDPDTPTDAWTVEENTSFSKVWRFDTSLPSYTASGYEWQAAPDGTSDGWLFMRRRSARTTLTPPRIRGRNTAHPVRIRGRNAPAAVRIRGRRHSI